MALDPMPRFSLVRRHRASRRDARVGDGCARFDRGRKPRPRSLIEAAGIEPATGTRAECTKAGRDGSKAGQKGPQVGHDERVAVCPLCKGRAGARQGRTKAGRTTSIAGAQRAESSDADLAVIRGPTPDDAEVARVTMQVARRIAKLIERLLSRSTLPPDLRVCDRRCTSASGHCTTRVGASGSSRSSRGTGIR
jgi:hypothetical protein